MGYGKIWLSGKDWLAHRYFYTILVGKIPKDMTIDHLCRNHSCVNPSHMEVVTSAENTLRGYGSPAMNKRKTHCKNGHEFTPENTYPHHGTGRLCRKCQIKWATGSRKRKSA